MRYEVLGPLRIIEDGRVSLINARKIEILLAVLIIRSDQVVAADQLMTEIWGEHRPRRAAAGLYVYISQLRKILHRYGSTPISTRPPGYLLQVEADEIDSYAFSRLVEEGREHARQIRHHDAIANFTRALALWRGPILEDLEHGPIVEGFVTWMTEMRAECIELEMESQLALGRHRELVGRLSYLTNEYPLRETFYRQLMLALYRSERRAEALQVYQAARRTLKRELGLDPCKGVQDLHRAILLADTRLDPAPCL
jgi:SARP family transcriptional regulator, regulator of embCAB operon